MAKFFRICVIGLVIAACAAEPIRFRSNPRKNRFFARQEEAPSSSPAPAPYPPAGVTPEIPFELPNEETTVQPDNTYLPPVPETTPANTYGPPELTYGPPEPAPTPDNTYGPPDQTYGPPAPVEDPAQSEDQPEADPAEEPEAERIILVKRTRKGSAPLRQQRGRVQKLRSSRLQLEPIEIIRSQPVIAYSVQYKSF